MKLSFERVGAATGTVVATAGSTIPRGDLQICARHGYPTFARQRPTSILGALPTRRGVAGRLAIPGVMLSATERAGGPMGEKFT
jgi:hypothetical protein